MNQLDELALHVSALSTAAEHDKTFFASIIHYVRRFRTLLTGSRRDLTKGEMQIIAKHIEEFFAQWRPTGDVFYLPPREAADSDRSVLEINRLVHDLAGIDEDTFERLKTTGEDASREERSETRMLSWSLEAKVANA